MRSLLILGVLIIFVIAGFFVFSSTTKNNPKTLTVPISQAPETVETKAAFAIFTHGVFRIFTAAMYHNLSTDVYIESSNPNIVYVKRANITWDDFFNTLPFKLSKECLTTGTGQTFCTKGNQSLRFYLNGKVNPNALDQVIKEGDQLLVTFGDNSEAQIQNQLQQVPEIK
ncbi:MAG TPA: hypothetical protein VLF20_02060 [Patescibacteria group bacterium]|nr:hypothetical protein [Patescibacteria group bacterium]